MSNDEAKSILNFLAKSIGAKGFLCHSIQNHVNFTYMHNFYVLGNDEFAYAISTSKGIISLLSRSTSVGKPYLWCLRKILKESQNGNAIAICGFWINSQNIFLKPKTTLEEIKIKMDLYEK